MSDLASTYAKQVGVKLSNMELPEKFFPTSHPIEKIIIIHAGAAWGKFQAKIYDYFNEVIQLSLPVLLSNGYKFFQVGLKDEPQLAGIESLLGKTTIAQLNFLIKNCAAFIGNDSMGAHIAGGYNKPEIVLFGATSAREHGPHWKNEEKAILLESHRFGKKTAFYNEPIKTINLIKPELVVESLFKILDIPDKVKFESIYIGNQYNNYHQLGGFDNNNDLKEVSFHEEYLRAKGFQNIKPVKLNVFIEIVPNQIVDPNKFKNFAVNIRCDFYNDDKFLFENLKYHKATIIANNQFNLDIIKATKTQINEIKFEINENIPIYWYKNLKKTGVKTIFFTKETNVDKIQKWREMYFDYFVFDTLKETTKEDFIKSSQEYNNIKDLQVDLTNVKVKSNKLILSDNKVYLTKAHYLAELPLGENKNSAIEVIDNLAFWSEYQHLYFYKT
jgi:hypothetical protein